MEDKEVWEEVPEFENYLVSNHGNVYGIKSREILNPKLHVSGNLRVRLYNRYENREFYIHHLVALCFFDHDTYMPGMHIRHRDDDLHNNHVSNLAPQKKFRRRRRKPEEMHTKGLKVMIVETGDIFSNAYACAQAVGGDVSTIYKCLRGERPKHMGYSYDYVRQE